MDMEIIKDKCQGIEIVEKENSLQDTSFNVFFENGYGASVVRGPYTYGGDRGLYEVAVIEGIPEEWELCYETSITNDVVGYLSKQEVMDMLINIQKL